MVKITPEKHMMYLVGFLRDLYVMWSKAYKSIYVELHKMDREYLVLISYKMINEKSWDWIDRVKIIKTDRKHLLIVKKEILMLNLPDENGDMDKDTRLSYRDPDFIKPECDMIVYLPLLDDVYGKISEEDCKKLHDRLLR